MKLDNNNNNVERQKNSAGYIQIQYVVSNVTYKYHVSYKYVDSAIGLHLRHNPDSAAHYHDRQFSILAKAKTQFYLAVLKAIFIKTQQSILCRQKESVYSLRILL